MQRVRGGNPLGWSRVVCIFRRPSTALAADLDNAWEVLAEAVQTVMRKCGQAQPYEQLKALTRGRAVTREAMQAFILSLDLPEAEKARLLRLTPATYTG